MTTDTIWGIERTPHAVHYGELVVEVALLYHEPAAPLEASNITGALAHGSEVEVIESQEIDSALWCKVAADIEHEGQIYEQRGWLRASLLKDAGEAEFV